MFEQAAQSNFCIHFVGIGGIGMSGIAEIMHSIGYVVKGSDRAESANLVRLKKLGITVFIGHDGKNVDGADIVVFSSAINGANPEIDRAKELKIPILTRAEMLSQLVRFKKSIVVAGSHGKTTVTSLCSSILELASFSPTTINGGIINAYKTNAKLGKGEWAVIESDESDGSFVKILPTIGIVTNIDKEHINYYGSFDNLKNSFLRFLENLPFFGYGIVCNDDKNASDVVYHIKDRKIFTYSIENDSSCMATNVKFHRDGSSFDVKINWGGDVAVFSGFKTCMVGKHNVLNSLVAISIAYLLKINMDVAKTALVGFLGVRRRFTLIGEINGISFIDDYAHHPTEIESLFDSSGQIVEKGKNKIIVCQPHRFTRLNSLFDEFVEVLSKFDVVVVVPVYKADDKEMGKINSVDLYHELLRRKGCCVYFCEDEKDLFLLIKKQIDDGDIVCGDMIMFAGAGSISRFGHFVFDELRSS